jgi:repressor LexA
MEPKEINQRQLQAIKNIRNWIMHHGRAPSVRELMNSLGYKSPRSVSLIIEELVKKGVLKKKAKGEIQLIRDENSHSPNMARTVNIPLVGSVACGLPILAEENIEAMIPVSIKLAKPGSRYFLLRAHGDSMDKAGINDGDFVLVRQQSTVENGDKVVALIDEEATIKEFYKTKTTIILKPRSSNKKNQPIILNSDFQIQGIVIKAISNFD